MSDPISYALSRFARLWIVVLIAMVGCSKPLPPEFARYEGQWEGPGTYLWISADGSVEWERKKGGATTSIEGPINGYNGHNFDVGVGCISATFEVSDPPHQLPNGRWVMTVDGVPLVRTR